MSKAKLVFFACAAASVFSAVASTTASAAWMVDGANLVGSKSLSATTTVLESFKLEAPPTNLIITCTSLGVNTGVITATNTGSAESLEFSGCQGTLPCTTPTTISTVPVSLEALLDPSNALATNIKFKPKTKNVFATFLVGGATCSAAGNVAVTGTATVLAPEGFDERTYQLVVANVAGGELKLGSNEARLKGKSDLKLLSSEPWSYL
jgi:hypothetical protein